MFYDDNEIEPSKAWGLPIPNEEAAYKSLAKYAKDQPFMEDYEIEMMNVAWEMTAKHFGPYMRNSKVRTYEEVKSKLDMSTSSGAPFNILYPTKKDLFEADPAIDEWFETTDWLRLATDPEWTCLCTNALKEEMRLSEKIDENSIRTFTAMACDMTIHGNRLFADMNEKMNASWLQTASTVGWSPMQGNWDRLIRKLKVFKHGYALDESQYDSSLRSYMMWGCARFRWSCLRKEDQTPENLKRLKTIYRNLVNTLIITPEGVLVMKTGGNPSGSPNTINDNTLILYTLMCYAWLFNHPGGGTSLEEFEDNTAKALTGDDNTWTVSDWANEFYNARTVIACWKRIGITTTTDCLDSRAPDELDYLSAHTIYVKGIAVPQYSKEKIMSSLLYSQKIRQTPAQALERTNGMLNIAFCDLQMQSFLRDIQQWLLKTFDKVCVNDQDWIMAKCGIHTDEKLYELWLGKTFVLDRQSFPAWNEDGSKNCICDWGDDIICTADKHLRFGIVKRKKDKSSTIKMNRTIIKETLVPSKRGGRRGGRKGPKATRKPKQAKAFVAWTSPVKGRVSRKQANLNVRGMAGRNRGGRNLAGRGGTRNRSGFNKHMVSFERDEYIGEILSGAGGSSTSSAFSCTSFPINPGQASTFPWLSPIAARFEKYRFDMIEFYYRRENSEFATAGTVGKVIMSIDFDASDAPPTTKQQMEDTEPHSDGMPSENVFMPVTKGAMANRMTDGFFIRPGGLPGGSDIKTYDIGNLNVATQGINAGNAAVALGELRVRYKVRLMIPVLESSTAPPTNNSVAEFTNAAQAFTTATPANMLLATVGANGISAVNTAGSIVLPTGNYLLNFSGYAKDSAAEAFIAELVIEKNGTPILTLVNENANATGGGVNQQVTIAGSKFIQSNGTDAFLCLVVLTGAAGTLTMTGDLVIVSI